MITMKWVVLTVSSVQKKFGYILPLGLGYLSLAVVAAAAWPWLTFTATFKGQGIKDNL